MTTSATSTTPLANVVDDALNGDAGWARLRDRFESIEKLFETPQDPQHHPEGDAGTHTRLVVESLSQDPLWLASGADVRAIVMAAALFHDIGKGATTRVVDGRFTSPHHASIGAIQTRELLWRAGIAPLIREQVASLVRWHMKPNFLAAHHDAVRLTLSIAETTRCDWLAMLSRADTRGRGDGATPTLAADFLTEWADELNVPDHSFAFDSDHARVGYYAHRSPTPSWMPYDDTWGTVTVLAGLPGVGKDRWIAANAPNTPVVSLDAVRRRPGNEKLPASEIAQTAYAEAQELLGRRQSFIWNATNLYRDFRGRMYDLCHRYHAATRTVLLETDPATLDLQNKNRPHPVGPEGMARMLHRWDPPDRTETYSLDVLQTTPRRSLKP